MKYSVTGRLFRNTFLKCSCEKLLLYSDAQNFFVFSISFQISRQSNDK